LEQIMPGKNINRRIGYGGTASDPRRG